ncbi:Gfo/Idh/MocA family protein [Amycolatopsis orientalis]|uniref:Gfo/Idh/MocA family protein n=1 Tax=Amycolatopsis orientalis TaxID=31958 RepID=UPI000423D4F0|nr:Gfo/Idh/MocA family oxidoreductase [Amycolatopsis orientalis]
MVPRRYAIAGLGSRAELFVRAIAEHAELAAFCDRNRTRMAVHNDWLTGATGRAPVPCYPAEDFTAMLEKERIDVVVVCTPDHTHAGLIADALGAGCAVITEKPMAVDATGCRRILEAQRRTGGRVTVGFNYRYNPLHRQVRDLLADRVVGDVGSVDFEWLLDTQHGADYFRRWHRDKAASGGLLVHKASHHFDLVNWWLGSRPETVFAMGRLFFYGEDNGGRHGLRREYERATGDSAADGDPFALDLGFSPRLSALYRDAEQEDHYLRDLNVFGPGITIEDDMTVLARYEGGPQLSYHLVAYSPWEGYRVAFTGSEGRLELAVRTNDHARPATPGEVPVSLPPGADDEAGNRARLTLQRHWAPPETIFDGPVGAGHGGGDERMLAELLAGGQGEADHLAGMWSLAVGLAANRSIATGEAIDVRALVTELGMPS